MTARLETALAATLALIASAGLAVSAPLGADYATDAGPPLRALLEGDASAFFAQQPIMGTFSLLIRAPFAALASLGDGSDLLVYRLGAFPCVAAAGLLAVHLFRRMGEDGRPSIARVAVATLCVANPITVEALAYGHPEEVLGGALCVGAVAQAGRGRWLQAAVLLGLALATKQWAVIAVVPALIAAPAHRLRLLGVSAAIAAALTAPLALGDPREFVAINRSALVVGINTSASLWWPLASTTDRLIFDGVERVVVSTYTLPGWLVPLTHPLIVLAPLPLGALWLRRRRRLGPEDALALLALLFLLRCVLDPVNIAYYHVPFLLAMTAYEGLRRSGLPILSVLATAALVLTFQRVQAPDAAGLTWAVYMAWSLPLVGVLAMYAFALPRASTRAEAVADVRGASRQARPS